jgi:hypothetical protein
MQLWPDVAIKPRPTEPGAGLYVRAYVFQRLAIGALALALPPLLVFGEPLVFDGQPFVRGSLSAYYYSGAREVFVGVIWAIGVFLITYKVLDWSRESMLSTFAGLAAIFVAVFPTGRPGDGFPLTPLQELVGEGSVEKIHFVAAATFILLLAWISSYFARKRHTHQQLHWACTVVILLAGGLALLTAFSGEPDKGILIAEWSAVWAFAASWLATVEPALLRPS